MLSNDSRLESMLEVDESDPEDEFDKNAWRHEREYCWRDFEQEYIQFFDIHNCLFMLLHFSIGGYDYCTTAQFRQLYPFQHHSSPSS